VYAYSYLDIASTETNLLECGLSTNQDLGDFGKYIKMTGFPASIPIASPVVAPVIPTVSSPVLSPVLPPVNAGIYTTGYLILVPCADPSQYITVKLGMCGLGRKVTSVTVSNTGIAVRWASFFNDDMCTSSPRYADEVYSCDTHDYTAAYSTTKKIATTGYIVE
jgi:hypothetical protein